MPEIHVQGEGWSHDVLIGPVTEAGPRIAELCRDRPIPLVSDDHVLKLHGTSLERIADFRLITLPRGEQAKGWDELRRLVRFFAEIGVDRQTPVLALGGGSIGDVAGLAASLFKRGCPIIHLPTTLLAMVDSAIGGKTAIDDCGQKNLVGSFHPPAIVVCDPAFLATLDDRQYRGGYSEIAKYGLIDDPSFFGWCESNGALLLKCDPPAQVHAIEHCVTAKARFVQSDLHDRSGQRALLNLGHSFAHAIEARSGLGQILHGEAVSIGLCMAFDLSVQLGLCPADDSDRVRSHLRRLGLQTTLASVGLDGKGSELLPLILADKKSDRGKLTLILVKGIGRAFVARGVETSSLTPFLERAP